VSFFFASLVEQREWDEQGGGRDRERRALVEVSGACRFSLTALIIMVKL
jgi:predicted transporter